MKKFDRAVIAEYDWLSQTADENSWIKKLDEFMSELERYEQFKKK